MWKITPNSELVELATTAAKHKSVVWLPLDELAFFEPTMPLKRRKTWRQTIPFALEDALIHPIEKTHFAYPANTTEQVPVIAVLKSLMDDWLALLQKQSAAARTLIPELYALPYSEGRVTIWHEGERCLMRNSRHSGQAGSTDWIASLISVHAHAKQLDIYSDHIQALPEAWQQDAKALPASLDEMMAGSVPSDIINLLQGEYGSESGVATYLKPWRAAIGLTLLAFATHLSVMFFDIQRYNLYAEGVQQQATQLTEQLQIPGNDVSDLRAQVTRYIQRLQSYGEQRQENAWQILAQVDDLLSNCRLCRVEKLELRDNTLVLDVSFTEKNDRFKQQIENLSGFTVKSKSLPNTADGRSLMQFELGAAAPRSAAARR